MTALLRLSHVTRTFPRGRAGTVTAVDDLSLEIERGTTFGLVGESGSGKSTLGRIAVLLLRPDRGEVAFAGTRIDRLSDSELRPLRQKFQYVFQDPAAALNPRMTVEQALAEPIIELGTGAAAEAGTRVEELLDIVELNRGLRNRYPHQLSGGELQRVGIARALAVDPDFLVLDEPTSAVDVSVQAHLLALFSRLQRRLQLTYLLISHDLGVIAEIAEATAVMYAGRIVESGPTDAVLDRPRHPYTARLVESIPSATPAAHLTLRSSATVVLSTGPACSYYDRCGHPARDDRCRNEVPAPVQLGRSSAVCHHATQG